MAHHEQLCIAVVDGLSVELECPLVKPSWPGLLVIMKGEPKMFEFSDLRVVIAPPQVYDVGYTEGLQLLHVSLGLYCASKREPFAHEEGFHRLGLLSDSNRPRRLKNLYFVNAALVHFLPIRSSTCNLRASRNF